MEVYTTKPCFIEEEGDGLLWSPCCLNNMKKMNDQYHPHNYYYHKYYYVSSPSDNSSLPHFLDSCFLCKKRIADNRDIFMYRGDTPFCSEECREEQIKRDEAEEKKHGLSSSVKAMRRNEKQSSSSSSSSRSCDYALHNGTVVTA